MDEKKYIVVFDDEETDGRSPALPSSNEPGAERQVTAPPSWATERTSIIKKLKRPGRPVITGGIGAGKSLVAEMFVELGAGHIDFDRLARRVVDPGTSGFSAVVELLGSRVVTKGVLDRPKIAALIYADKEIRTRLEAIIHPRVWLMMGKELDNADDSRMILISIPLLFEAGLETFFNPIILVYAEPEVRLKRLKVRNSGLDESIIRRMMDSQWPDPPKIMVSDYVIHNGGQLARTRHQVQMVYSELEEIIRQTQ